MPLRCVDEHGENIHAFDLASANWEDLAEQNRKERHLRLPCCSAKVTLRRSLRGTQFFAHKAVGACVTAAEKEEHLRLKQIAVEAARAQGWEAATEIAGVSPNGERWQADVMARKNSLRVAVEIQWSNQTVEETRRRQERYQRSGVRCLWLLRKKSGFPVTRDLPVAQIIHNGDDHFEALLSSGQNIPVRAFLDAAFGGRFKFGVPLGEAATVSVRIGSMSCWHAACRAQTNIITGVDVVFGPNVCTFHVADLGDYPDILGVVSANIPSDRQIGAIKQRFSKTQAREYLSNGCYRCDRIIGEFFEHYAYEDQDIVCSFPIRLSKPWKQAIDQHNGYDDSWAIYLDA